MRSCRGQQKHDALVAADSVLEKVPLGLDLKMSWSQAWSSTKVVRVQRVNSDYSRKRAGDGRRCSACGL